MNHWHWDAQDKQTLAITGLFSIQAVRQGRGGVLPVIEPACCSSSAGCTVPLVRATV